MLLLAVPGIALLIFLQKRGAGFAERIARRFFPQMNQGVSFHDAIVELYSSPSRLAASAAWHLVAWVGAGGGTFISFQLIGGDISLANAIALEALLCTLRSIAAPVPAAIGVQEWGYAMLAPLFGLPAEMGLAVSLLKRAREIVLGDSGVALLANLRGAQSVRVRARAPMSRYRAGHRSVGFCRLGRGSLPWWRAVCMCGCWMRPTASRHNITGMHVRAGHRRHARRRVDGGGHEGRALFLPCRRRLSALGARSRRNRAQQPSGRASQHGRGAEDRRGARGLYLVGRRPEAGRHGGGRNLPATRRKA